MNLDEKRLSAIVSNLSDVLVLVGGRQGSLYKTVQDGQISECLLQVRGNALMITEATRASNSEHTDWKLLENISWPITTNPNATISELIASAVFTEATLDELSCAAGWTSEIERDKIDALQYESQDIISGWRMMVGRARWGFVTVATILGFLAITTRNDNITWGITSSELLKALIAALPVLIGLGYLTIIGTALPVRKTKGEDKSTILRRYPFLRAWHVELRDTGKFRKAKFDVHKLIHQISLIFGAVWLGYLIGLL